MAPLLEVLLVLHHASSVAAGLSVRGIAASPGTNGQFPFASLEGVWRDTETVQSCVIDSAGAVKLEKVLDCAAEQAGLLRPDFRNARFLMSNFPELATSSPDSQQLELNIIGDRFQQTADVCGVIRSQADDSTPLGFGSVVCSASNGILMAGAAYLWANSSFMGTTLKSFMGTNPLRHFPLLSKMNSSLVFVGGTDMTLQQEFLQQTSSHVPNVLADQFKAGPGVRMHGTVDKPTDCSSSVTGVDDVLCQLIRSGSSHDEKMRMSAEFRVLGISPSIDVQGVSFGVELDELRLSESAVLRNMSLQLDADKPQQLLQYAPELETVVSGWLTLEVKLQERLLSFRGALQHNSRRSALRASTIMNGMVPLQLEGIPLPLQLFDMTARLQADTSSSPISVKHLLVSGFLCMGYDGTCQSVYDGDLGLTLHSNLRTTLHMGMDITKNQSDFWLVAPLNSFRVTDIIERMGTFNTSIISLLNVLPSEVLQAQLTPVKNCTNDADLDCFVRFTVNSRNTMVDLAVSDTGLKDTEGGKVSVPAGVRFSGAINAFGADGTADIQVGAGTLDLRLNMKPLNLFGGDIRLWRVRDGQAGGPLVHLQSTWAAEKATMNCAFTGHLSWMGVLEGTATMRIGSAQTSARLEGFNLGAAQLRSSGYISFNELSDAAGLGVSMELDTLQNLLRSSAQEAESKGGCGNATECDGSKRATSEALQLIRERHLVGLGFLMSLTKRGTSEMPDTFSVASRLGRTVRATAYFTEKSDSGEPIVDVFKPSGYEEVDSDGASESAESRDIKSFEVDVDLDGSLAGVANALLKGFLLEMAVGN
eukprot:CAMPEP_0170598306 /NCGR_PEP_ID=MMETSP0224-20130122/16174_1 /TAXON_ID=285029 /ORGANISM="Togula jolla, Strain CCCM 725" /LENGTH=818 /DNA_ID=CAMNT_0010922843 /DNA_START=109 /DNA_END=2565 /DNA_ORIENTATION=+